MARHATRVSRGGARHPPQQPAYYYEGDSPVAQPYAQPYGDPYGYDDPGSPQMVTVPVPVQVRRQSLANGRLLVGQVQAPPPVYTESELHHHHHHHHVHGQPRHMATWNNAAFQQVGRRAGCVPWRLCARRPSLRIAATLNAVEMQP